MYIHCQPGSGWLDLNQRPDLPKICDVTRLSYTLIFEYFSNKRSSTSIDEYLSNNRVKLSYSKDIPILNVLNGRVQGQFKPFSTCPIFAKFLVDCFFLKDSIGDIRIIFQFIISVG